MNQVIELLKMFEDTQLNRTQYLVKLIKYVLTLNTPSILLEEI
jgi:hypothetical protein